MKKAKNTTYLGIFGLLYLLCAIYYLCHPQEVLTYYHNSEITYFKAQDMANGHHQWGMFFDGPDSRVPRYEFHMPEGPTYVMALWIKLGLPISAYRIVPIFISLLAHVFFLWTVLLRYGTSIKKEWLCLGFFLVALQPMIVAWSKAVDDGSYNVSLMVLMISVALIGSPKRWITYLILGFLLGCQEFYRQPMMIMSLWFVEYLKHNELEKNTKHKLLTSFLWASIAGVGVVLGLLFHIGQLALVWGSWSDAWAEMAGAALGRASIMNELNPDFYHAKLHDQITAGAPLEWVRIKTMFKIFVSVFWYDQGRQYVWPIVFLASGLWWWKQWPTSNLKKQTGSFWPLSLAFLFLIPNIWTMMMPNHASVHFYYIARDYIGLLWGLYLLKISTSYETSTTSVAH